eukprot:CAMPEP_0115543688 /NCGR_PEP_ID=MMETSP0271-20121206/91692_1 /TAXON_ID=71861 /ORGANISM="Scrippsiella trochoidea, Strain CCMP3099" /LENGTH=180 /DNA_ID=CAMNT_0002976961 /DNA_START=99 /DNA_END=638 /DNA_ORIENTATION=-
MSSAHAFGLAEGKLSVNPKFWRWKMPALSRVAGGSSRSFVLHWKNILALRLPGKPGQGSAPSYLIRMPRRLGRATGSMAAILLAKFNGSLEAAASPAHTPSPMSGTPSREVLPCNSQMWDRSPSSSPGSKTGSSKLKKYCWPSTSKGPPAAALATRCHAAKAADKLKRSGSSGSSSATST